jgi:hypothetical protein
LLCLGEYPDGFQYLTFNESVLKVEVSESYMPLIKISPSYPNPLSDLKPLQPLHLFLLLSYLQIPVDDDVSLLDESLPPFDDAFRLPQLSFPLQLISPSHPHPLFHQLPAQGLQRALPFPLHQVEKEGAEGKDCQPVKSTAMEGMQTWDQMGSADPDALE